MWDAAESDLIFCIESNMFPIKVQVDNIITLWSCEKDSFHRALCCPESWEYFYYFQRN